MRRSPEGTKPSPAAVEAADLSAPARTRFNRAAWLIAWRQLHRMVVRPTTFLLPSVLMPIFFFVAFAGGLSAVSEAPSFDYPNYTTFQYVFVLMQSAVFGGVFAGFSIAADFETGFVRRMMVAVSSRPAIIAGYAIAALGRAILVWAVVTVIALISGAEIGGGVADLLWIALIAVLLNVSALLFACGVAMRLRSLQAAPLIQLPAFLLIMTAPVYVPRDLIEGWVHTVSDVNPMTAMLEAGRELIIGDPARTLAAVAIAGGLIALTAAWARTGLTRAEGAG